MSYDETCFTDWDFLQLDRMDFEALKSSDANAFLGMIELLQIKEKLPEAAVYMMAYYPVNVSVAENQPWQGAKRAAELRLQRLEEANHAVKELAAEFGYYFIDVNKGLTDENGQTRKELSIDGIHMWSDAYEIIFENMKKYILE